MKVKEVIRALKLERLPEEGGYYRETYRAKKIIPAQVLKGEHEGERNFSTAIYYLLTPTEFSALHKLPQDEVFHFYLGDPVEIIQINPSGDLKKLVLGPDISKGQSVQTIVPGNTWQGMWLMEGSSWALLGTTVAPGFDFKDFQLGERKTLIKEFPQHKSEIVNLTRDSAF